MQDSVQLHLIIVYPPFQRSSTVTLALADYWTLYWIANRLTPRDLQLLYTVGDPTNDDRPAPFPMAARYALLRALQAPIQPLDTEAALEIFSYDLLSHGLIVYQEATALAAETLNKCIQVDAWAKRISRYADRNHLPRLDGRKTKRNSNAQHQEQPFSWHARGVTVTISRLPTQARRCETDIVARTPQST